MEMSTWYRPGDHGKKIIILCSIDSTDVNARSTPLKASHHGISLWPL